MRAVVGVIQLIRPVNSVLFLAGTAVGGILVAGLHAFGFSDLYLAMVSAALVGCGANAVNDIFDLDIDRVNRPDRPLPSGVISQSDALIIWILTSVGGILLALLISVAHTVIAVGSVALLTLYSSHLKRTPLIGNAVVALAVALALIYGGWAVGQPQGALVGAFFAFLTTLGREIVKDLEDVEGDAQAGVRSLPILTDLNYARWLSISIVGMTVLLTPLPYLLWGHGGLYLVVVLVANFFLLTTIWLLASATEETMQGIAGKASKALKVAMIFGLAALAASPIS